MTGHASASRIIDAPPDDVFNTITDVSRLADWNDAITAVIEQPDQLEVGAQWVVEMHALGQSWHSRSTLEAFDTIGRCFAYRSATDDGNPSYALWTWVGADNPRGALVTVACELHPISFWRRVLLVEIRARQLARTELPHSLAALEAAAKRSTKQR
jgi:Polyketide cyclase / dehydrase and lipid transport